MSGDYLVMMKRKKTVSGCREEQRKTGEAATDLFADLAAF